ncbi:methionine ABC transporter ATP-binding protein [Kozakia baliensis]|uniref:Cell division ATP-binding protein FtsE n=1 Tax=Kozakia baliensis TaxID=153496 RepID=A0A1D8UTI3_9PROT|nr:ATP-binding cassette domain-containing protein [Kozakia baliensis]AOX16954.1 methionine ABC transporter ATP-binding protein [Kozakia baliensis]GEL63998.1 methionine import ATP-binding protein MetN [Kozakia baliensis]
MSLLHVDHVSHRFGGQLALDDIDFRIEKGEIVGVIGRSGAGKSTLLRCLCALERPQQGRILLENADLVTLPERELVTIRRKIGLVFQHFNLLESRNVAANIELPLQISGASKRERTARVEELIELVGLSGHAARRPSQLSGGQKQRVGIARALAGNPSLLLCDEATSALDPETTTSILELLRNIHRKLGLTIVLITHEMDVVRRFAQRILVLDHGRLVEDGDIGRLMRDGLENPHIAALLADIRPQLPPLWKEHLQSNAFAGAETLIRLALVADNATMPLLSILDRRFAVEASLLQGGVTDLAGSPTADMIVRLSNNASEEVFTFLRDVSQTMEVIGYVAPNR